MDCLKWAAQSLILFLFVFSPLSTYASETHTIELDLDNYIPVIQAEIEGEKMNVLFDSGATTTLILKQSILNRLTGTQKTGRVRKSVDARGVVSTSSEMIVPMIKVNSMIARNVPSFPYQPWGMTLAVDDTGTVPSNFHERQSGVLGLLFFEDKKLIIDYPNKKIVAFTSDAFPKPYHALKWIKANYVAHPEELKITGCINGTPYTFILDTGATASILHPNLLEQQGEQCRVNLAFGDFKVKNQLFHSVNFKEPQVDGILGYNFFENVVIFIDQKNQIISFSQPTKIESSAALL